MSNLSNIISQLAAESKTSVKQAILQEQSDNVLLKDYFNATLNPFINYYIRLKEVPATSGEYELDVELIKQIIATLHGRVLTGHAARDYLNEVLASLTTEDQILLKNMINRDANCKVAEGLVNKCWKGLIPEFPCMLAESYDEKTIKNIPEGPNSIIVQKKEDGGRVAIVVSEDHAVTIYSRAGNILETFGVFDAIFAQYPGKVFDGELVVSASEGVLPRTASNGIFNKAVRGTISQEEAEKLHVVMWDVIDLADWKAGYSKVPYSTRLETLNTIGSNIKAKASVIETEYISTHDQAMEFYARMVAQGYEGAMVKRADMIWENRRSKFVLKLKGINDATLKVVGVKAHSKYPELIGSLECATDCGMLEVSVGSGLSADDRTKDPSEYIGKYVDIMYNMIIKSKNSDKKSLFLPRLKAVREDKTETDKLETFK